MKHKIILLILLLPVLARAQRPDSLHNLADSVIEELKKNWTLGVDSNSTSVDIGMYNQFKNLFAANAKIDDDLNFQFIPAKGSGTYKIIPVSKDFDEYAHDVALGVTKLVDSSGEDRSKRKLFNNDSMVLVINRFINASKPARYVLQDVEALARMIRQNHPGIRFEKGSGNKIDSLKLMANLKEQLRKDPDSIYKFTSTSTLRITLAYTADSPNQVKITRIQVIGNTVTCTNDDDGDGVLNEGDFLPAQYGDFTAHGAPDDDLDGVADAVDKCKGTFGSVDNKGCPESYFFTKKQIEGFIGLQFNSAKIILPDLHKLGYKDASGADATDVLQSKKGKLKNPGPLMGIYAGGNFVNFFGRYTKGSGVTMGFTYSRFVADYELTEPLVYTYKSSDGIDPYRRQITIGPLKEQIGYSILNIPLQYNYRTKQFAGNKWVINMKTGPSFMLFTNTTNYDATIDVGGVYQIDPSTGKITYSDFFDKGSTWNVYLTSDSINQQNPNPGAAAVFAQLNSSGNYDFVSYKNYHGQKKLSRTTIGFNFSLDGQYKRDRNNPLSIKFGIHFVYAPSMGSKEKYKPIERTSDEYNSIFNSNGKSVYFAYGLNIGLVYDF